MITQSTLTKSWDWQSIHVSLQLSVSLITSETGKTIFWTQQETTVTADKWKIVTSQLISCTRIVGCFTWISHRARPDSDSVPEGSIRDTPRHERRYDWYYAGQAYEHMNPQHNISLMSPAVEAGWKSRQSGSLSRMMWYKSSPEIKLITAH